MKQSLVTISIPTKNSGKFLERCLSAIKNQTYENIEVNLVDAGSNDSTIAIANSYGITDILVYRDGLLGARYEGVKISRGDFVLLLDSDQILEPTAIARAVETLRTTKSDMLVLEETVYKDNTWLEKLFKYDRQLIHNVKDFSPNTGVMLPRFYKKSLLVQALDRIPAELLPKIGGQDHAIIYFEAWHYSEKVALLPASVKHIEPDNIVALWHKFYRWGRTSVGARYGQYDDLLKKKERFRVGLFGTGMYKQSLASIVLLLLKGVPFYTGYFVGKIRNA
jgi:glycosyltransferase involved in cell wall biosynthesis